MSNRMNYGVRFRGGGATAKYDYDEKVDKEFCNDHFRFMAIKQAMPKYKQELSAKKTGAAAKKRCAAAAAENHRYEAEQRMAEAVRKAVAMLEFGMSELMQHRLITGRPKLVCQNAIHNVIVTLRNKCGVSFDHNPEYTHILNEDYRRSQQQQANDIRAEIEQQRLSRLRMNRELAERIAARHNARRSP